MNEIAPSGPYNTLSPYPPPPEEGEITPSFIYLAAKPATVAAAAIPKPIPMGPSDANAPITFIIARPTDLVNSDPCLNINRATAASSFPCANNIPA